MKQEFDEYELKIIEWLKQFKNRTELVKNYENIYYGLIRTNRLLLEKALPIINTAQEKKQYILAIAKNGEKSLSLGDSLYYALRSYTAKSSKSYDKNFVNSLKKIRPDWFSLENNYLKLIKMMPKCVSLVKNQEWRGLTSEYSFICDEYGEFRASPTYLISQFWRKGISGHPKSKRVGVKLKVKCSNGKIYNSLSEASRELKLNVSHIGAVARKERKSTGGYTFTYIEEEND